MKKFLLIVTIAAASVHLAAAQKGSAAAPAAKTPAAAVKLNTVKLGKWGIDSIDLPGNLSSKNDEASPQKNGDVTWTESEAGWTAVPRTAGPKIAEVKVNVTTWDVPFARIAPDMPPDLATPEGFLQVDLMADIKSKQQKNSIVLDADYHDIDGARGELTTLRDPGNKTRILVIWQTFRYYKNKPQRVKVEVTAAAADKPAAKMIVDSLRLEK